MRAIILAGGKGRRLQPYTTVLPKPLMPLGDQSILEIVVRQLKEAGFTQLTIAVGYLAELIRAVLGDGERFGLSIEYSHEERPLGTAGPLSLVTPPDDDFLVMNGDVVTDLDFIRLMEFHKEQEACATLAVFRKRVPISLGVLEVNEEDEVVGYTEKPTLYYPVSTGIYCFRPDVLRFLEKNESCDLPDLVQRLMTSGERVKAHRFNGYWLDIGRPEDYETAIEKFDSGRQGDPQAE